MYQISVAVIFLPLAHLFSPHKNENHNLLPFILSSSFFPWRGCVSWNKKMESGRMGAQPTCTPLTKQNGGERGRQERRREFLLCLNEIQCVCVRVCMLGERASGRERARWCVRDVSLNFVLNQWRSEAGPSAAYRRAPRKGARLYITLP